MRPLSASNAIHLVLKSQWAKGRDRFTSAGNQPAVQSILKKYAEVYNIKIFKTAICGNHIHLLIRARRRWRYRAFICVITGVIAQHVMGKQSFEEFREDKLRQSWGEGYVEQEKGQGFWLHRPFTRITAWGRDYVNCLNYLARNTLEALGFIEYKLRVDYYAKWRVKYETS